MTVAEMEARVARVLLKAKPLSAGELARRCGLSAWDGSGRTISQTLANLVAKGRRCPSWPARSLGVHEGCLTGRWSCSPRISTGWFGCFCVSG